MIPDGQCCPASYDCSKLPKFQVLVPETTIIEFV